MPGLTSICRTFWLAATIVLAAGRPAAACTITVSHSDDPVLAGSITGDRDNRISLREAAEIGAGNARCYSDFEKARISGANFTVDPVFCQTVDTTLAWRLALVNPGCGPNDADFIRFADSIVGGNTVLPRGLITIDARDSIEGNPPSAGARPNVTIDGSAVTGTDPGAIQTSIFSNAPASGTIKNLYIQNFVGYGIHALDSNGFKVFGVTISGISGAPGDAVQVGPTIAPISATLCAFSAEIGGTGAEQRNYFYGLTGSAIRIGDFCASASDQNNKVFNNYIGICEEIDTGVGFDGCPTGTANQAIGAFGVRVTDVNGTRVGGSGANEGNYIGRAAQAGVLIAGSQAHNTLVRGNRIGFTRTFTTRANGDGVRIVAGAYQNTVGGVGAGEGNVISGNSLSGVAIDAGAGNAVRGNIIGLNPTRGLNAGNATYGVALLGDTSGTGISDNVIAANSAWGIAVFGNASGSVIERNVVGLRGGSNTANDNTAAGNGQGGIDIESADNQVAAGNRIAANNGPGVLISGESADRNRIAGNVIGLSAGNDLRPNSNRGVYVRLGADDNIIGGSVVADRNTISGNGTGGVYVSDAATTGTVVRLNYIGTDPTGASARANAGSGIAIANAASGSVVRQNLVSGNSNDGITLLSGALANSVLNNQVGINLAGNAVLPNAASGIALLSGASNNDIGDPLSPFGFNAIAGNAGAGIFIADAGTSNNRVVTNIVGSAGFPNSTGVLLTAGAQGNRIGGNVVRGNSGAGVVVFGAATTGNAIRDNQIGANGGLGIDLGDDGVTINDPGDPDTGPNGLQNAPVIASPTRGANMASMTFNLNSAPSTTFALQVFWSLACDPIGRGEGENLLGSINLATAANSSGAIAAMFPLSDSTVASTLTALATDPGNNTSEFSPCAAFPGPVDLLFANGYETAPATANLGTPMPMAALAPELLAAGARLVRLDGEQVAVEFAFDNPGPAIVPAHSVVLGSARGVGIESIASAGASCKLRGAIQCEVSELAPGARAALRVVLRAGAEPLQLWFEDSAGARGVLDAPGAAPP